MKMSKRAQSALRNPEIPSALRAVVIFAAQNPGLEYGNYASGYNDKAGRAAYFSESRRIMKQWQQVRYFAMMCETLRVTDDDIYLACSRAYSGRLSVKCVDIAGRYTVDYCAGQYWCSEFRAACAAVLELAAEYAFRRQEAARTAT